MTADLRVKVLIPLRQASGGAPIRRPDCLGIAGPKHAFPGYPCGSRHRRSIRRPDRRRCRVRRAGSPHPEPGTLVRHCWAAVLGRGKPGAPQAPNRCPRPLPGGQMAVWAGGQVRPAPPGVRPHHRTGRYRFVGGGGCRAPGTSEPAGGELRFRLGEGTGAWTGSGSVDAVAGWGGGSGLGAGSGTGGEFPPLPATERLWACLELPALRQVAEHSRRDSAGCGTDVLAVSAASCSVLGLGASVADGGPAHRPPGFRPRPSRAPMPWHQCLSGLPGPCSPGRGRVLPAGRAAGRRLPRRHRPSAPAPARLQQCVDAVRLDFERLAEVVDRACPVPGRGAERPPHHIRRAADCAG